MLTCLEIVNSRLPGVHFMARQLLSSGYEWANEKLLWSTWNKAQYKWTILKWSRTKGVFSRNWQNWDNYMHTVSWINTQSCILCSLIGCKCKMWHSTRLLWCLTAPLSHIIRGTHCSHPVSSKEGKLNGVTPFIDGTILEETSTIIFHLLQRSSCTLKCFRTSFGG